MILQIICRIHVSGLLVGQMKHLPANKLNRNIVYGHKKSYLHCIQMPYKLNFILRKDVAVRYKSLFEKEKRTKIILT